MKKKLTKKQKDNAFIKKIGSLTLGGKAVVGKSSGGCPVCGKKGSHMHKSSITFGPAMKWCEPEAEYTPPPKDDSQEQSLCN